MTATQTTIARRLRPIGAAAALVLLAACAGSSEADTTPASRVGSATTPPPASAASSTTTSAGAPTAGSVAPTTEAPGVSQAADGTRSVASDGFSLDLPDTWSAYTLGPDGTVEALDGAPALAPEVGGLAIAAGLQGASLFATAPPDASGRYDTVLVTRTGGDDQPASADVSEALRERMAADGVSDLQLETIDVGGRPAARATFRQIDQGGLEQEAVTVYVPDEEASFVVSFSRPLPSTSDIAVVDGIIATFRLAET